MENSDEHDVEMMGCAWCGHYAQVWGLPMTYD